MMRAFASELRYLGTRVVTKLLGVAKGLFVEFAGNMGAEEGF